VKQALATVVVFRANSHDGAAGHELAESYKAKGLPHFVLMDASGAPLDRWIGFRDAADWLKTFEGATSDLTTVAAKEMRYKQEPTEALAAALGRIHGSLHDPKASVADYREAEKLAGGPKPDYTVAIFYQTFLGQTTQEFTLEEVKASADDVMTIPGVEPIDTLFVASAMADLATDKKDPELLAPYLEPALAASSGLTDERSRKTRADLEVAGALLVKGDKELALSLKRKAMPGGWEQSPSSLNEFAWWCFENQVNLEEAEALARKGAELAPPGPEKAEILDTVAEICNLLGNCDDAVALSEQAAKEDPNNDHYPEQVKRFAGIRDKKNAHAGA
jgi:tetratricopeptide (TPR) repeat protein